ncbi:DUF4126 domain-containing protein [Hwanghaeella grinnelliae]|uniref:DUF4126 domain-containing protein n=1 Tax=Hwanghaeella grinnelliae TaxID=2500179 RepID=A0A437QTG2_9PROT|nr:DUF4126 domain-containing protein [Hwanghaeella grinnelliae]RVU37805.1 DUF4126 domain-containing protein [Hwanghaeella grinnelliae]
MESLQILALALGAAWASGINLYATVTLLGVLNMVGVVPLPDEMQILSNPLVLAAAATLFFVEFLADKIPAVDSLWDAIHTFIRIPAGALMAVGAADGFGGEVMGEDLETIAALVMGGTLAASSHLTKATSRAVINTSPEPFSNWFASFFEDFLAIGGVLLAVFNPLVFLGLLALFVLLAIWLVPKLWRVLRFLLSKLGIGSPPKEDIGAAIAPNGLVIRGRPAMGSNGGPPAKLDDQ